MTAAQTQPESKSEIGAAPPRLLSIDTYRGLVMFLMLAEVLHLCGVADAFPESGLWNFLCFHQSHVEWRGCSLHDLIQPSFSFLVGTALAFSIQKRQFKGQSTGRLFAHAAWRALALILLGVFLRSLHREQTNWTFEDTLTQIGLGYFPLFLVSLLPRWCTWAAMILLVAGYWTAFAIYPLPDSGFDPTTVGIPADWPHWQSGFAAHWNKNANLASDFDVWFLNQLPRAKEFVFNGGGYVTLSFIPTLATMLLGLIAGHWLVAQLKTSAVLIRFALAAAVLGALGWGLDQSGLCPSVKRIWTPAWVMVSGGYCMLILGSLHAIVDRSQLTLWTFPLRVIGCNSIAAYLFSWLTEGAIKEAYVRHFGLTPFQVLGPEYEGLLLGGATLGTIWLFLYGMYRQKFFLKL